MFDSRGGSSGNGCFSFIDFNISSYRVADSPVPTPRTNPRTGSSNKCFSRTLRSASLPCGPLQEMGKNSTKESQIFFTILPHVIFVSQERVRYCLFRAFFSGIYFLIWAKCSLLILYIMHIYHLVGRPAHTTMNYNRKTFVMQHNGKAHRNNRKIPISNL